MPGSAFSGSRSPLSADFTFGGETLTVIQLHSTSRGGSTPLFGAQQPQQNAGDTARTAQSNAVRTYVDGLLATNPAANIIVAGDFNGFTFENSIRVLTNGGILVDANTLLPVEERYSYTFDANAQQLDHILVTPGILATATYDTVHGNAEQSAATRPTDHDPSIVLFSLGAPVSGTPGATTGNDRLSNPASSDRIDALAGFDTLDMAGFTSPVTVNLAMGTISIRFLNIK